MKYKNETGIIVGYDGEILYIIPGYAGHVVFPDQRILDLHAKRPGMIGALAHSHPPHMPHMSGEDTTTLRGWARALYPFPARLVVLSQIDKSDKFQTTGYLATYESMEEWIARGKPESGREVYVRQEYTRSFWYPDEDMTIWEAMLVEDSYTNKPENN